MILFVLNADRPKSVKSGWEHGWGDDVKHISSPCSSRLQTDTLTQCDYIDLLCGALRRVLLVDMASRPKHVDIARQPTVAAVPD